MYVCQAYSIIESAGLQCAILLLATGHFRPFCLFGQTISDWLAILSEQIQEIVLYEYLMNQ